MIANAKGKQKAVKVYKSKRDNRATEEWQKGRVFVQAERVFSSGDGEIKIEMDRRRERGFNELMTVLTTRCLLS